MRLVRSGRSYPLVLSKSFGQTSIVLDPRAAVAIVPPRILDVARDWDVDAECMVYCNDGCEVLSAMARKLVHRRALKFV